MTEAVNLGLDPKLLDYQSKSIGGKPVLITGETRGIGRATAMLLATQWAQVTLFGTHEKELNETFVVMV